MLIWILAIVILAFAGYAGYALGAIRAGFTLIGLWISFLLAFPLGKSLQSMLGAMGLKNPLFAYFLGPVIVFLVVLTLFKLAGFAVHRKVDVYYKYKAGDLRMGLFERLNHRVGVCLGVANAATYLILLCLPIYIFSYTTVQIADDQASGGVKMLNSLGRSVKSSGMAKITAALDPVTENYYKASDIVGLIYHNDLLESRLSRYPAFLLLGEKPEFQEIANDKEFTELRLKQPRFSEILNHPKAQAIVNNPDLLKEIWATSSTNLNDLQTFLTTGQSPVYGNQEILGRWNFDLNGALAALKESKPNAGSTEMQHMRKVLFLTMSKSTLIAAPNKQLIIKNVGEIGKITNPKVPPTVTMQNWQAEWDGEGKKYLVSISSPKTETLKAEVQNDRLTITGAGLSVPMVFNHEL